EPRFSLAGSRPEASDTRSVHYTVNGCAYNLVSRASARHLHNFQEVGKMPDLGRIAGPIVIPNCIEVDLLWNLASGKQVKNVLHGQVAAGFNATAAVAQAVYAAIIASGSWTAWGAFVHTTASPAAVNLRDPRTANMPVVSSTGVATAGTGAAVALPPGSALVVTLRTASAGR